jgi:SAM-dependent methyltransferase
MSRHAHIVGGADGADSAQRQIYLTSVPPEEAYERLTGYAFARRYVAGKSVADVRLEATNAGAQVLAETASRVTVLTDSRQAAGHAEELHPTPNTRYERVELPALSQPDDSFDAVIALQVIEHLESPEDLIREAKSVLKPDGVFIVSTPDKQARANERNHPPYASEMYVPELRELLDRHFGHVSLRRQGAVAGGFVSGTSEDLAPTPLESVQLSSTAPSPGPKPPPTGLVMAVCSDAEVPEEDEGPYLLLDRDRRVFEEDEDHREDIELLRDEVRRMQETEVQSFQNTLMLRSSEVAYLKSGLGHANGRDDPVTSPRIQELKVQNEALKRENDKIKNRLHSIEGSHIWRLTAPYRRGRLLLDSWLKGESREGR